MKQDIALYAINEQYHRLLVKQVKLYETSNLQNGNGVDMSVAEILNIILIAVLVLITAYYAWQTNRQVNLSKTQLTMLVEQRRKSIAPALKIESIKYADAILNTDQHTKIMTPNLTVKISNIGSGPALDLNIIAEATVLVQRLKAPNDERYLKMTWEYYIESRERHLEEHYSDTIKLILTRTEIVNTTNPSTEMSFKMNYRNIDRENIEDAKEITMGNLAKLPISGYDCIVPGDDDYPKTIEPRAI